MATKNKPTIAEKAKEIINWSALSEHLAHNKDSIRANRMPSKYEDDIKLLLSYVEAWMNCKELATKEELINQIGFEVGNKITELSQELLKLGKNPFNKT